MLRAFSSTLHSRGASDERETCAPRWTRVRCRPTRPWFRHHGPVRRRRCSGRGCRAHCPAPPPASGAGSSAASPRRATPAQADVAGIAAAGVASSGATLPHLDRIQASFGHHDVSGINAHVGGNAAVASEAIGARAYATGNWVTSRAIPTSTSPPTRRPTWSSSAPASI